MIAEFSGSTGSLLKEYIYGADGLLATIEPTAVNSNGTPYTTSDHLGSPRVVTNSGASVISRHDYMPFGEELGAGVGGRTTGMGYPEVPMVYARSSPPRNGTLKRGWITSSPDTTRRRREGSRVWTRRILFSTKTGVGTETSVRGFFRVI